MAKAKVIKQHPLNESKKITTPVGALKGNMADIKKGAAVTKRQMNGGGDGIKATQRNGRPNGGRDGSGKKSGHGHKNRGLKASY
jgi:hypothetical protein